MFGKRERNRALLVDAIKFDLALRCHRLAGLHVDEMMTKMTERREAYLKAAGRGAWETLKHSTDLLWYVYKHRNFRTDDVERAFEAQMFAQFATYYGFTYEDVYDFLRDLDGIMQLAKERQA